MPGFSQITIMAKGNHNPRHGISTSHEECRKVRRVLTKKSTRRRKGICRGGLEGTLTYFTLKYNTHVGLTSLASNLCWHQPVPQVPFFKVWNCDHHHFKQNSDIDPFAYIGKIKFVNNPASFYYYYLIYSQNIKIT